MAQSARLTPVVSRIGLIFIVDISILARVLKQSLKASVPAQWDKLGVLLNRSYAKSRSDREVECIDGLSDTPLFDMFLRSSGLVGDWGLEGGASSHLASDEDKLIDVTKPCPLTFFDGGRRISVPIDDQSG